MKTLSAVLLFCAAPFSAHAEVTHLYQTSYWHQQYYRVLGVQSWQKTWTMNKYAWNGPSYYSYSYIQWNAGGTITSSYSTTNAFSFDFSNYGLATINGSVTESQAASSSLCVANDSSTAKQVAVELLASKVDTQGNNLGPIDYTTTVTVPAYDVYGPSVYGLSYNGQYRGGSIYFGN